MNYYVSKHMSDYAPTSFEDDSHHSIDEYWNDMVRNDLDRYIRTDTFGTVHPAYWQPWRQALERGLDGFFIIQITSKSTHYSNLHLMPSLCALRDTLGCRRRGGGHVR